MRRVELAILPLISIIVPIYNVEEYLEKCVKSIINQTYKNIEIILVNDGSPDNCSEMCDYYATIDERVVVIHKENGGLSDARNAGLGIAKGKYIMFVDSDDYINVEICEHINEIDSKYGELDIITGNANVYHNEKKTYLERSNYALTTPVLGSEYLKKELSINNMSMAAWLNIYSKKLLLENNLKFKKGILHEDEEFTPRVFLKSKRVIFSNKYFYNYMIREGSITQKKDKTKNAHDIFQTSLSLENTYNSLKDEELKKILKDSLVVKCLSAYHVAKLYKRESYHMLTDDFLKRNSFTKKTIKKVRLFIVSRKLYGAINTLSKLFQK